MGVPVGPGPPAPVKVESASDSSDMALGGVYCEKVEPASDSSDVALGGVYCEKVAETLSKELLAAAESDARTLSVVVVAVRLDVTTEAPSATM